VYFESYELSCSVMQCPLCCTPAFINRFINILLTENCIDFFLCANIFCWACQHSVTAVRVFIPGKIQFHEFRSFLLRSWHTHSCYYCYDDTQNNNNNMIRHILRWIKKSSHFRRYFIPICSQYYEISVVAYITFLLRLREYAIRIHSRQRSCRMSTATKLLASFATVFLEV
jgi:hypothetical protein